MSTLYTDIDEAACHVIRELIADGCIPPGEVWQRDIREIEPDEIRAFTQVHLFAGYAGWALALRMAGWPDDRPVWTGSCPCQPFSAAGKRQGTADERHLWPDMLRLIAECRPAAVFGEQVASKAGRQWLAGVFADLEDVGYAVAGADLCAAGVGAPHIRQRLWWVADHASRGLGIVGDASQPGSCGHADGGGEMRDGVGDAKHLRSGAGGGDGQGSEGVGRDGLADAGSLADRLGDAKRERLEGHAGDGDIRDEPGRVREDQARPAPEAGSNGAWSDAGIVECREPTRDGGTKTIYRRAPLEPGIFPLAHGTFGRREALRLAGNGIVVPLAAVFIEEAGLTP